MRRLRNIAFLIVVGLLGVGGPEFLRLDGAAAKDPVNLCVQGGCWCDSGNHNISCSYYPSGDFCEDALLTCRDVVCQAGQMQSFHCDSAEPPLYSADCVCAIEGRR